MRETAVVTHPDSKECERDGCVDCGAVAGVKKQSGDTRIALVFSDGQDCVPDVDCMLQGVKANVW